MIHKGVVYTNWASDNNAIICPDCHSLVPAVGRHIEGHLAVCPGRSKA